MAHDRQEAGGAARDVAAEVVGGEVLVLALGQPPAAKRDGGAVRLAGAWGAFQDGAGQCPAPGVGMPRNGAMSFM